MKTPAKDPKTLPPIAACPSCGRRPSERISLGWAPQYEGPTTLACSDGVHDEADLGPALVAALAAWMPPHKNEADTDARDKALAEVFEKLRGAP